MLSKKKLDETLSFKKESSVYFIFSSMIYLDIFILVPSEIVL